MTVYSVYVPPGDDADLDARVDKIAFVKEGFYWVALLVPVLWLIYQRMWLELVVFLAVLFIIPIVLGNDPAARELGAWLVLGLTVVFAFEANDLRGWALQRRGYRFVAAVTGRDRTEAERSFFTDWLPQQLRRRVAVRPAESMTPKAAVTPTRPSAGDEVIGSFPRA